MSGGPNLRESFPLVETKFCTEEPSFMGAKFGRAYCTMEPPKQFPSFGSRM